MWPRYVTVAERRDKAAAHARKLAKKGHIVRPVELAGHAIATTFWGKAWCANLERYSDYGNRLPRGRSYVRNGSVVDLQIQPGVVTAMVSGSHIYTVTVKIRPFEPARWQKLCGECAGRIESAVELLKGNLSGGIMAIMTDRARGLFPAPGEISIACTCPDYAGLCKHSAATLYGVAARLDQQPKLLFILRNVNTDDLLAQAGTVQALTRRGQRGKSRRLDESNLSGVFGIDLEPAAITVKRSGGKKEDRPATPANPASPPASTRRRRQTNPRRTSAPVSAGKGVRKRKAKQRDAG